MPVIYHVTTAAEWENAQQKGAYTTPSLQAEGFIHCSADDAQVAGVLQRYFAGKTNLLKLVIDTDKLKSRFIYEWSPSTADTFPHVYGPINLEAVIDSIKI
ncbi:MAG TPA: DUF952 domain-containing protein [Chitinophagaceae bacterium]|nr:DUF952 domain-containing protein [Chitinophagaceae bacterium]